MKAYSITSGLFFMAVGIYALMDAATTQGQMEKMGGCFMAVFFLALGTWGLISATKVK